MAGIPGALNLLCSQSSAQLSLLEALQEQVSALTEELASERALSTELTSLVDNLAALATHTAARVDASEGRLFRLEGALRQCVLGPLPCDGTQHPKQNLAGTAADGPSPSNLRHACQAVIPETKDPWRAVVLGHEQCTDSSPSSSNSRRCNKPLQCANEASADRQQGATAALENSKQLPYGTESPISKHPGGSSKENAGKKPCTCTGDSGGRLSVPQEVVDMSGKFDKLCTYDIEERSVASKAGSPQDQGGEWLLPVTSCPDQSGQRALALKVLDWAVMWPSPDDSTSVVSGPAEILGPVTAYTFQMHKPVSGKASAVTFADVCDAPATHSSWETECRSALPLNPSSTAVATPMRQPLLATSCPPITIFPETDAASGKFEGKPWNNSEGPVQYIVQASMQQCWDPSPFAVQPPTSFPLTKGSGVSPPRSPWKHAQASAVELNDKRTFGDLIGQLLDEGKAEGLFDEAWLCRLSSQIFPSFFLLRPLQTVFIHLF
eukprot:jgi/Botrbrau1/9736/Bobra.0388s0025.1